jgi:acetyl-CoA carboxylase biotin carboxyl carrier protein
MARRSRPASSAPGADDRLVDLTRRVAAIATELGLSEIEVESAGMRLRVQRASPTVPAVVHAVPAAAVSVPGTASVEPVVVDTVPPNVITVEAPMVGTFYRASGPTAEPFVREGDVVKEGQILCIIEAMKLMNEIEAKAAGRIVKVLVENGQPVEYGQRLFLIEPVR